LQERGEDTPPTVKCGAPVDRGRRRRQHCRPVSDANLPSTDSLTAVLACPRCRRGPVAPASGGWICGACSSGYPVIGDIPWLFPEPQLTTNDVVGA